MSKIKTRVVEKDIKVLDRKKSGLANIKKGYVNVKNIKEQTTSDTSEEVRIPTQYAIHNSKKIIKTSVKSINTTSRVAQQPDNYRSFKKMHRDNKMRKDKRKNEKVEKVSKKHQNQKDTDIKKRHSSNNSKNHTTKYKHSSNKSNVKKGLKGIKNDKINIKISYNSQLKNRFASKPKTRSNSVVRMKYNTTNERIKKTKNALKTTFKSGLRALKRIIQYSKLLISALLAAGNVVITIILIITMIAMIVASPLGIFFSNENYDDSNMTLTEAIVEINNEYNNKITTIKNHNLHDELDISGSRANWKDVLSVYAVKTVTEKEIDVVTIDDERLQLLKDIFFDMNVIEHSIEYIAVDEVTISDDGNGNLVEEILSMNKTILKITIKGKTAPEMADNYYLVISQNLEYYIF
jgi:hypothetical protein